MSSNIYDDMDVPDSAFEVKPVATGNVKCKPCVSYCSFSCSCSCHNNGNPRPAKPATGSGEPTYRLTCPRGHSRSFTLYGLGIYDCHDCGEYKFVVKNGVAEWCDDKVPKHWTVPTPPASQSTVTRTLERCRDFFAERSGLAEARLLEQECITSLALLRAAEGKK